MRYFVELSFFGKNYYGWQIQPDRISVQEKIENALRTLLQEKISIVGAGRTDSGVHATQMYAHFDTQSELDTNFVYRMNSVLPNDIVIHSLIKVSNQAHARFDASSRSYQYRIFLGRDPFTIETTWQVNYQDLDIELMNKAAITLLDYQDFQAFSKVKTDVHTFNCSVTQAKWVLQDKSLIFYISANRFLRNMVRAIVGTLLDVGLRKITLNEFKKIIESKNRSNAGVSVPAKGLFLTKVEYSYL